MNTLRLILEATIELMDDNSSGPLYDLDLLKSALAKALLGLDLAPLRPIWKTLKNNTLDEKPLEDLIEKCTLLSTGEMLFPEMAAHYENMLWRIGPAFEQVHPGPGRRSPFLYERMLDLAIALELRAEGREQASLWRTRRLQAPPSGSTYATLLGLLASAAAFSDSMLRAEAIHMSTEACLGFEPALVMTLSFLAREQNTSLLHLIQGGIDSIESEMGSRQSLLSDDDHADPLRQVKRSDHTWAFHDDANTIEIRVVVEGLGQPLHAVAGWAVAPLIYELPDLIKNLYDRNVPLQDVKGARSRKRIETALGEGGSLVAISELHNATISTSDQAALRKRFDVCEEWIHACYPEISCSMRLEFRQM